MVEDLPFKFKFGNLKKDSKNHKITTTHTHKLHWFLMEPKVFGGKLH